MEMIQWEESYSVGNQLIDTQHKKLLEMINLMIEYEEARVDSEIISELLSRMTEYARYHFEAEESYMEQITYPHLENHKEEHKQFRLKVGAFCQKTMSRDPSVPEKILQFLAKWLIHHILHSDMKYKMFFESKHEKNISE